MSHSYRMLTPNQAVASSRQVLTVDPNHALGISGSRSCTYYVMTQDTTWDICILHQDILCILRQDTTWDICVLRQDITWNICILLQDITCILRQDITWDIWKQKSSCSLPRLLNTIWRCPVSVSPTSTVQRSKMLANSSVCSSCRVKVSTTLRSGFVSEASDTESTSTTICTEPPAQGLREREL